MDQSLDILTAKTAILEQVCLALLIERAASEGDPKAWVERFGKRFRNQIEEKARILPSNEGSDVASVIALEVLDSFLDRLRSAVARRSS